MKSEGIYRSGWLSEPFQKRRANSLWNLQSLHWNSSAAKKLSDGIHLEYGWSLTDFLTECDDGFDRSIIGDPFDGRSEEKGFR